MRRPPSPQMGFQRLTLGELPVVLEGLRVRRPPPPRAAGAPSPPLSERRAGAGAAASRAPGAPAPAGEEAGRGGPGSGGGSAGEGGERGAGSVVSTADGEGWGADVKLATTGEVLAAQSGAAGAASAAGADAGAGGASAKGEAAAGAAGQGQGAAAAAAAAGFEGDAVELPERIEMEGGCWVACIGQERGCMCLRTEGLCSTQQVGPSRRRATTRLPSPHSRSAAATSSILCWPRVMAPPAASQPRPLLHPTRVICVIAPLHTCPHTAPSRLPLGGAAQRRLLCGVGAHGVRCGWIDASTWMGWAE